MSHHLVEVEDLRYIFPDGTIALNGVTFTVTHGQAVAVVGANGAGKSTLLSHLNGYLAPQAGKVRIGDSPLTNDTLADIRKCVGMIFQDPDDQLFMPTAYEDVAFGPLNLGLPLEEVDRRVKSALARVGASHLREKAPYHLSGGEKRAVAIATVLAMEPSILVLDEPSSNLDPAARRRFIELLKAFEHTKIIATHDLEMALELCERTIVLKKGEVVADGQTRLLFSDPDLMDTTSLEVPLSLKLTQGTGPG